MSFYSECVLHFTTIVCMHLSPENQFANLLGDVKKVVFVFRDVISIESCCHLNYVTGVIRRWQLKTNVIYRFCLRQTLKCQFQNVAHKIISWSLWKNPDIPIFIKHKIFYVYSILRNILNSNSWRSILKCVINNNLFVFFFTVALNWTEAVYLRGITVYKLYI